MATTVFSRISAALAAIVIIFSGCGGGDEPSAALALSGPAVDRGTTIDGRPRMKALSVPASKTAAVAVTDDQLFDWAEGEYASYFSSHEQTLSVVAQDNTYHYRFYPATGNYVARRVGGSDDGGVYVLGPFTGNTILRVGHTSDYACLVAAGICAGAQNTDSDRVISNNPPPHANAPVKECLGNACPP